MAFAIAVGIVSVPLLVSYGVVSALGLGSERLRLRPRAIDIQLPCPADERAHALLTPMDGCVPPSPSDP